MSKIKKKNSRTPERPDRTPAHHGQRKPSLSRELAVLYEDDAVIVVNKPAGLLSVPIKGSRTPSALSLVSAHLNQTRQRALIVHRIDRFVSGILLFAKSMKDRENLVGQFLEHTPERQYLAVVRGRPEAEAGTLVHYFRREGMFQQLRTAKDPQAARAELRYSVERVFSDASLVRVELVTGLQNQIRVQFAAIGCPVIGDRKYNRAELSEQLIDRVALHAAHLRFVHPRTGEEVSIACELPDDFEYLIGKLKPLRIK